MRLNLQKTCLLLFCLLPSFAFVQINCSPDTVEYADAKSTGYSTLAINDLSSARSVGMYFDAPQPIYIHGFTFHAYKSNTTGGSTLPIICELFAAGADSNPNGGALAVDTVIVNTSGGGQALPASARYVVFNPPVKVVGPYVLAYTNYDSLDLTAVNSSWVNGDGQKEWLACANIGGNWFRPYTITIGTSPVYQYDSDPMIFPHVTFDLEAGPDPTPKCLAFAGTVVFQNNTSGVAWNRFYNQNVYFGTENNSYSWDFDDGSPIVSVVDTNHSYSSAGPYNVSLAATVLGWNSNCVDTTVVFIPGGTPSTSFTSSSNLLSASFSDASSGAVSWLWDFGDGGTDTLSNPNHVYASVGTYTVCLTTTNACGSDSTCQSITITCPLPVSSFTTSVNGLTGTFTSTTTGANSYLWTFQNAGTDTSQNTMKTWNSGGTYQACLEATNTCGMDTSCQNVTVACAAPVTSFTSSSILTTTTFNNTSFSVTIAIWDFGDGNTSTQFNPTHTFPAAGTYTVCLIGTNTCGMGTDTICQQVTVTCTYPTANFNSSAANLLISFSDTSTGIALTSWAWDFGDGNSSTLQNPVHAYDTAGTYTVCLTTSNQCGGDTICKSINVICSLPVPSFTYTQNLTTVDFMGTAATSAGSISAWAWNFGDGQSSTMQNPSHNYAFLGVYTVCLTATDTCGSHTECDTVDLLPPQQIMDNKGLSIILYPNPTSGKIFARLDTDIQNFDHMYLMDIRGVLVLEEKDVEVKNKLLEFDLSGIDPGIYLFSLKSKQEFIRQKIVISR